MAWIYGSSFRSWPLSTWDALCCASAEGNNSLQRWQEIGCEPGNLKTPSSSQQAAFSQFKGAAQKVGLRFRCNLELGTYLVFPDLKLTFVCIRATSQWYQGSLSGLFFIHKQSAKPLA